MYIFIKSFRFEVMGLGIERKMRNFRVMNGCFLFLEGLIVVFGIWLNL